MAGIGWTALGRVFSQVASLAVSVALARLLTPADFGLIGITTVFTGFAALFAEMGFSSAIIQAKTLEETHRSSIFWLNVAIGIAMTLLLAALAPAIAAFFGEPRLKATVAVLSVTFAISSLSVVQRALLLREMNFRSTAIVDTTTAWLSSVLTVILALAGWGVWSLVAQSLIKATCASAALWMLGRWRPRLHFRMASVRDLLGYSANLAGFGMLNYWIRNVDNLLIGKFFGSSALGLYTRAYTLMLMPMSQLTNVLGSVMFPALAKIQGDGPRVKRAFLRANSLIAFVTFPTMFGLAAVSHDFVLAAYGERWLRVAGLLQVLSIVGGLQSIQSTVGWIYRSEGRTDVLLRWGLFAGAVMITSIAAGVALGSIETVAICYAVANISLTYPNFSIPGRYIGLSFRDLAAALWRTTFCSVVMALTVAVAMVALRGWGRPIVRLVIEVGFGMFVYSALVWFFNRAVWFELRSLISSRRSKPAHVSPQT